jgi:hypothetical protein
MSLHGAASCQLEARQSVFIGVPGFELKKTGLVTQSGHSSQTQCAVVTHSKSCRPSQLLQRSGRMTNQLKEALGVHGIQAGMSDLECASASDRNPLNGHQQVVPNRASAWDVAGYCNMEPRFSDQYPDEGFVQHLQAPTQRGHFQELTSSLASQGNKAAVEGGILLDLPAKDHRGMKTGQYVCTGIQSPCARMGLVTSTILAEGSVACIKPVSRLKTRLVGWLPDVQWQEATLSWESRANVRLPVESTGAHAIDGFELTSNFTPSVGMVFFTLPKSSIADAAAVRICYLTTFGTAWTPLDPERSEGSEDWTFTTTALLPGIYLLVSLHARGGH